MKWLIAISMTLSLSLMSCITITQQVASGAIEERIITFSDDVDALAMSSGFDVVVDSTLPRGEVRVTTHTDIFYNLDIYVENSSLHIGMKSHRLRAKVLEVRVPALDYQALSMSGGVDFEWYGCDVPALAIAASGGADAKISGKCKDLSVAISGGADLELIRLHAENVELAASGGADVEVYASKSLTVEASGGADVEYAGNPEVKDIRKSGGAEVDVKH